MDQYGARPHVGGLLSASVTAGCGDFAGVARAALGLGAPFFDRLLHPNPPFGYGAVAPHHRSPVSANKPAGRDPWALMMPGFDDSTTPIAVKCQSFLDNVVAHSGRLPPNQLRENATSLNLVGAPISQ